MAILQAMKYRLFSTSLPYLWILPLLLLCNLTGSAQKQFDFNTTCRQAYKEIMQLKLEHGQRLINFEKSQHPNNLIPYLLENYIDFFTLFFNEDPAEYKKRFPLREQRLKLFEEGPKESPFYLFSQSAVHFQWAATRIKFGYRWDAGWEFRRSFLQIKENGKRFADFSPNQLYEGAMQVTISTIPDGYKWLSSLLGMRGNMKTGLQQVESFMNAQDEWAQLFHEEAIFYYCYLQFYVQNNKEGISNFLQKKNLDLVNNHLFAYLAVNLSINNQQGEKARKILEERSQAPGYLPTAIWDLEMGFVKLHRLEPDAGEYLERFVRRFPGNFYIKDAYQKLSWHYYLLGQQDKAEHYRREISNHGNTDSDADKLAQKDAELDRWPNKLLLKARLLNDGGYFREALRLLHGKRLSDFASVEDQLEFSYRVGRLYDDMGADEEAIPFYQQAVKTGEFRREYFAARAALQLGMIYERRKNLPTAINWYQRCLNMKDHDFKNSLDQRAKAGVERCKAAQ